MRQFVERAEIDALAHIRDIGTVLRIKSEVVGRGSGILGAITVAEAVRPHVLRPQSESARKTPVKHDLQAIEVVASTAGFSVDFGELVRDRRPADYAELTNRGPHSRCRIHDQSEEHTSELQS